MKKLRIILMDDPMTETGSIVQLDSKTVQLTLSVKDVEIDDHRSKPVDPDSNQWATHVTHCCKDHGCKYGNRHCPVYTKAAQQEHPCEYCHMEREQL